MKGDGILGLVEWLQATWYYGEMGMVLGTEDEHCMLQQTEMYCAPKFKCPTIPLQHNFNTIRKFLYQSSIALLLQDKEITNYFPSNGKVKVSDIKMELCEIIFLAYHKKCRYPNVFRASFLEGTCNVLLLTGLIYMKRYIAIVTSYSNVASAGTNHDAVATAE